MVIAVLSAIPRPIKPTTIYPSIKNPMGIANMA